MRLAARLSQEELAERARLSVVSISALERGRRRAPYRETIRLLGDALELSDGQRSELEAAAKRPALPESAESVAVSVTVALAATMAYSGDPAPHNLPVLNTRLIGREDDVAAVVALVREYRIVTVLGTGGVGKTRTALAVGRALLASASAGVWMIDLAALANGSFVTDAVARALGVKEMPDRPLIESLLAHLKHKDAVLIFDNCEHVGTEAAARAAELLRDCEHLKILATSRERLRVNGERVYRLPTLSMPSINKAAQLLASEANAYAALALFIERARAVDHNFELDDDNAPVVAEICRLLDGIALAIELAAARTRSVSPRALLARLDQRLRILTGGDPSALPRQRTMRALIDWSYDLLTSREQRLFERLSVFVGGCDLTEAGAVGADDDDADEFTVLEALMSLADKSLLTTSSNGNELRYRLLESSRIYAAEKLTERGCAEETARRHARAYLDLAEELERAREVAPDAEWLARAEPELENWRTALDWSLSSTGEVVLGQRLAGALRPVWARFATAEGRRRLDAAFERVTSQTPFEVTLKLRFAIANVALVMEEHTAVLEMSMPLIDVCAAAGDSASEAYARCYAGAALVSMGRVAEAEPLLAIALDTARAQGKLRLTAWLLQDIAYGRTLGPNPAEARPYYAEALEIWNVIGAKSNAADNAMLLAENLFLSGELESALRFSEEAVLNQRMFGSTLVLVSALNGHATYLNAVNRWDDARASAAEAFALARTSDATVARMWSLQHLAATTALASLGDVVQVAKAAQLLGYVDAQVAAHGAFRTGPDAREYDRVCAAVNATLGPGECNRLMLIGSSLTHDRAIELARSL